MRNYFRTKLNTLDYKEWQDGFNVENIPLTILNKSYHLETRTGRGVKSNQYDLEISQTITVRLFLKGYRNPALAIDSALSELEKQLSVILNPSARLTMPKIKNIIFTNYSIEEFSESNDNSLILSTEFDVLSVLNIGG